jgi:two-component system nitrogen regulation response regulator GlnG
MQTLLVIDDEPGIRFSLQEVLQSNDLRVLTAENAEDGLRIVRQEFPEVILLDIRLGERSGLDVYQEIRSVDARAIVIFITGFGSTDTAIEAMKLGAYDYLVKPLDLKLLQQVVEQACKISHFVHVPTSVDVPELPADASDRLIGSGPAMRAICKQIGRLAPQDVNVLILGESGTGKELVARAIFHHSRRCHDPFLAINCAAIPETLLESELFGHEKGAFTGAENRRIGKFEQCHGGTIFLDEVGDMSLPTQAKILRMLQDGQFQRVGGNETLRADVRILAATNQDLDAMISSNRFRRDLYFRLRGVMLRLPPLRDHLEDMPELAYYYLFRLNREVGTEVHAIAPEALEKLQRYSWPGNVRELQIVLREALIASTGATLLPEFLTLDVEAEVGAEEDMLTGSAVLGQNSWEQLPVFINKALQTQQLNVYRQALLQFDRLIIAQALQISGELKSEAARLLGISRPTLRSKLRSLRDLGSQDP